MGNPLDFLGVPWAVGGFVDPADERAQQAALDNPFAAQQGYLLDTMISGADAGDEVFEPNVFAFIPTEYQVAAAIAAANMQALQTASDPVQTQGPGLAQLTQSLYKQAASLWQELSVADMEGW